MRVTDSTLVASITAYLESTKQTTSVLVRDAVEAYLSSNKALPSPSDDKCLVELSQRFTPWDLARMQAACEGKHQPTELVSLLLAFSGGEGVLRQSFLDIAARRGINIKPASE